MGAAEAGFWAVISAPSSTTFGDRFWLERLKFAPLWISVLDHHAQAGNKTPARAPRRSAQVWCQAAMPAACAGMICFPVAALPSPEAIAADQSSAVI